MMWQRETSYHNRRNYDEDAPRGASVSQARLTVAWLIDAARRQLEKLKPARREPFEAILLKPGDSHGFTILGSAIARRPVHERAIACPFPEEDEAIARLRSGPRPARSAEHWQNGPANDQSAPSPSHD